MGTFPQASNNLCRYGHEYDDWKDLEIPAQQVEKRVEKNY